MNARKARRGSPARAGLEPHLEASVKRTVGVPAACLLGAQDDPERYGLTVEGTCRSPRSTTVTSS